MTDTSAGNNWLQAFSEILQAEANVKIDKAIRLFIRCDDTYKRIILLNIGAVGSAKELRDKFDTLDLMDELDDLINDMEFELKATEREQLIATKEPQ